MHLQNLLKMPFRKLEACLWNKSFFNCFNFFQFKGNLCFRKSVIHAWKKHFRRQITRKNCYIHWSLKLPELFCAAPLDVPFHVLHTFWQRCYISEEVFENDTKFVTSQKILWVWVKVGLDSRRKNSVKLPKRFPQTVDKILVSQFFPSTWSNIGLNCKRESQSFGEKCSSCADDFWSVFKHGCKNKKTTRYHFCFWALKFCWSWFFRKLGAYVFAKRQFFKTLSFRKRKTSFSQTLTTWRKNVLKTHSRAITS